MMTQKNHCCHYYYGWIWGHQLEGLKVLAPDLFLGFRLGLPVAGGLLLAQNPHI